MNCPAPPPMFDFHNHFTEINAFKYTDALLPQNLRPPLTEADFALVGTSEIGLDKRYADALPLDKQIKALEEMLLYAKKRNIGVSLHCVGAQGRLLELLKQIKPHPFKCVWHGYNYSVEIARELCKLGVVVSISPRFNKDLSSIYRANPNLVLETDYTGNNLLEYNEILKNHYAKCASVLRVSLTELENKIDKIRRIFTGEAGNSV